jgi:hypothetical protein
MSKTTVTPATPARVVHQNERVPPGSGLARSKCWTEHGDPRRYVLAPNADAARAAYLDASGITTRVAKVVARGGSGELPDVIVLPMAD